MANIKELGEITEEIIGSWWQKYERTKKGFRCPDCHSKIMQTTCYVSLHALEFEPQHAGPGRVVHINYPYCPKCDGKLEYVTACFHTPMLLLQLFQLGDQTQLLNPGDAGGS
jgi:hypothetical protein